MEPEYDQHAGGGAGELVRAVWRRKWLPPLCFVLVVGPTLVYLWKVQQDIFATEAKVLLDIKSRPAKVLGAPELGGAQDLNTEVEIIQSQAILTRATNVLDLAGLDHDWLNSLRFDVARHSRVLTIGARGPTPEVAQDLANALADGYVEHRRQTRIDETNETLAWLREQQADAKVELLQAEEQFQKFKKANDIPSLESKREADVQRYQTLSDSYLQAQKLRIETETELRSLEEKPERAPDAASTEADRTGAAAAAETPEGEKPDGDADPGAPAPSSAVALELEGEMPPMLQNLDAAIREKEVLLKAQSEVLKDRHPRIRQLKRELEHLRAQYEAAREEMEERRQALLGQREQQRIAMLHRRLEALRREEKQAQRALEDWRSQLLLVTDVAVEYRILERETERARQSYELITEKIRELNLASAGSEDTARVLDRAQLGKPVDLHKRRTVILSVFGAGALAMMVALLLERLDTSIRKPEDVERYLSLPVLALIPSYPEKEKRRERRLRRVRKQRLLAAEGQSG